MNEDDPDRLGGFQAHVANALEAEAPSPAAKLSHTIQASHPVLALVVSEVNLYAGTQDGEILVWTLDTYRLLKRIKAHRGAVQALCLIAETDTLISTGGDAVVNILNTKSLARQFSIRSTYDLGDIYCLAYSRSLHTVYLGAQNTSIQVGPSSWLSLTPLARCSSGRTPDPAPRMHRFFDSAGPGGERKARPDRRAEAEGGGLLLELDEDQIIQYAHYGYVYCMLLLEQLPPLGEVLVSGGGDGSIKIWRLRTAGPEHSATLQNGDASVLCMATNGTLLYVGRLGGQVDVWDLGTRQLIQSIEAFRTDVLTLSVQRGVLIAGGGSGRIKVFERYKNKTNWPAHVGLVLASSIHEEDGALRLFTGGSDGKISVWELGDILPDRESRSQAANEELVDALRKFVAFGSISSDRSYSEDCRQAAAWLGETFRRMGACTELFAPEACNNPVVFAHFKGMRPDKPRILFYGHYDVFAADTTSQKWWSAPFELDGRDGYVYGRGVSDNKGPLLAAMHAVSDLVTEQSLDSDVLFLIEGEEERGSRGFEKIVRDNKPLIGHIDWILLANSYWLTDDLPCLTYGLRGVVHAEIAVENGLQDLHSGVHGSRIVDEPLRDLVALLNTINGPKGRVVLPGFYDCIRPSSSSEDELFKHVLQALHQESPDAEDADSLKKRWCHPSLTFHGFSTSSAGNPTVIPHRASASISLRLVPDQDALQVQQTLIKFLNEQFRALNTTTRLRIKTSNPVDPWLGDTQNAAYQTLRAAVIDVWGTGEARDLDSSGFVPAASTKATSSQKPLRTKSKNDLTPSKSPRHSLRNKFEARPLARGDKPHLPLFIREGGSIPAIRFLEKQFGAPAAQLPCGQASDNAHLDNERLRLLNLYNSRRIFRRVFRDLPRRT